jgi:hypothetical protein
LAVKVAWCTLRLEQAALVEFRKYLKFPGLRVGLLLARRVYDATKPPAGVVTRPFEPNRVWIICTWAM